MRMISRTLGVLAVALTMSACPDPDEPGGGPDGGGNGGGTTAVCTGTYSGAVTGKVKTCSLEATTDGEGNLVFNLAIEAEESVGISDNPNVTIVVPGDPKTGTYSGTGITQAAGFLTASNGTQYAVYKGEDGSSSGSVTLTIDSVPSAQTLGNGLKSYKWFGGKAQLQYVAVSGSGTVSLALDFDPQK